jgi:mannosyltransferase
VLPAQLLPAQLPPAQLPPAQLPPAQLPPAQVPPAQVPPAQVPPAQVPAAQPATALPARGGPGGLPAAPLWLRAVPPLLTLSMVLWEIGGSSYSRDDSATLSAVQRPFAGLLRMLGHVDVVHGAYYVIMWPVVRLAGSGELATRLPSALAMAAAAVAIVGLGQRLVSPRAGLAAGLVFAILPPVSWYGQIIRPYAVVTALAAAASYLLVRALQAAAGGTGRRGWLTGYAVCLAVLGYLHPFALLLIVAHAVPVGRAWLRRADRGAGGALTLGWLAAAAGALALVIPLMVMSWPQLFPPRIGRAPSNWMKAPALRSVDGLTNLIGPRPMAVAAGLAMLAAIAVSGVAGRARLRANWPGGLLALCLPWLILPPAILIGVSVISPVYTFRYIMFCAPAGALLIGAGLAALGWRGGAAALAIITALGVPAQLQLRSPVSHGDNIRQADRIVAENMRPGDVMLYETIAEPIESAYPYGLAQLRNVELAQAALPSGTLGGTWAPAPVVRQRVAGASRVWAVRLESAQSSSLGPPPAPLARLHFKWIRTWHVTGIWLSLYARSERG